MTKNEISLHDRDFSPSFPGRSTIMEKESGNEHSSNFLLGSREERASLLKAGLTSKDIESLYLKFNDIVVIGVNWQDLRKE